MVRIKNILAVVGGDRRAAQITVAGQGIFS
jgi:hypothetical protein